MVLRKALESRVLAVYLNQPRLQLTLVDFGESAMIALPVRLDVVADLALAGAIDEVAREEVLRMELGVGASRRASLV